jgi:hypothetical protein
LTVLASRMEGLNRTALEEQLLSPEHCI